MGSTVMDNHPLVSIIIPLYNREKIVVRSVESCLAQTYKNIEIIIVDDGSTDNSVGVVKELIKSDNRIHLLQNAKNENPAFSRNAGIAKAKGELITFLDSDDLILPNKIEVCVKAYQTTGADCINSPVISRFHNKEEEISVIVPQGNLIHDYLTRKIVWKIIGPVWSRKYIDKIGWFVPGKELFGTEDFEFHMRAVIRGVTVNYLSEPLSVQVNVDPAIDKAKIRQAEKFEKMARRKVFSRLLVFRTIVGSGLSLNEKVKYSYLIFYYMFSLMKNSFQRLSFVSFMKLQGYLLYAFFRKAQPATHVSNG